MNDKVYFWHADKYRSFLQVDTIILSVCNHPLPKYPKWEASISLQYLQKSMADEVDFLPADKHESFPGVDVTTLDVHSQACPKYWKQQVYNNIFGTCKGKRGGWSWFFAHR